MRDLIRSLIDEHDLTSDVFYRRRTKEEKRNIKQILILLLRKGYSASVIARELGLNRSTVSRMIKIDN